MILEDLIINQEILMRIYILNRIGQCTNKRKALKEVNNILKNNL